MKPYIRCPRCGYDIDVSDYENEKEGETVWCQVCENRTYYYLNIVKMQEGADNNAVPHYQYNIAQEAMSKLWKIKILRGNAYNIKEILDIIDSLEILIYNLQLEIHKDDVKL